MEVANALAYYGTATITAVEGFVEEAKDKLSPHFRTIRQTDTQRMRNREDIHIIF